MWASIEQGVLEVEIWDNGPDAQGARLSCALKAALVVARRLILPEDIADRLAQNFRQEPEAGVRLQGDCAGLPGAAGRPRQRRPRQPETLLLLGLQDDDAGVAQTAARALGQVGTIDAVEPLREHAAALLPSELRAAARQAIAEIQARLTGAEAGQLTLAGGEAGALSLAGEGGGLSLAKQTAAGGDVRRRRSQTEG